MSPGDAIEQTVVLQLAVHDILKHQEENNPFSSDLNVPVTE